MLQAANWLLTGQGRGKDICRVTSINAFLMLASFVVGLPFGPLGVAIGFSAISLLLRLPILYYIAGRRGPVRSSELWVMLVTTWLMCTMVADLRPLTQLLICAPVGVLTGIAFVCMFQPQRKVAIDILDTVRELKKNP